MHTEHFREGGGGRRGGGKTHLDRATREQARRELRPLHIQRTVLGARLHQVRPPRRVRPEERICDGRLGRDVRARGLAHAEEEDDEVPAVRREGELGELDRAFFGYAVFGVRGWRGEMECRYRERS